MSAGANRPDFSMNAALAEIIIKIRHERPSLRGVRETDLQPRTWIEFVPRREPGIAAETGRTTRLGDSGFANLLCATLNRRLTKGRSRFAQAHCDLQPKHLIYCCSQPLSEHAIDVLDKSIRAHTSPPEASQYWVRAAGPTSPRSIARSRKELPSRDHSVRTSLLERDRDGRPHRPAPALITIGTDDGPALRRENSPQDRSLELLQSEGPRAPRWPLRRSRPNLSCHARFRHALIEGVLKKELRNKQSRSRMTNGRLLLIGENSLSDVPPEATDYPSQGTPRDQREAGVADGAPIPLTASTSGVVVDTAWTSQRNWF